jgi:DNA invertase Pin-like site-specific DNA recombinase
MTTKFVVYYRVSTKKQGDSGLGLEAQQRDVELYLQNYATKPYEVIETFTEVDSGANSKRETLHSAIDMAKANGAILLGAKLDRISRKVSFIAQLVEDKNLQFKVCTMPNADKFQVHIYAALAEQERDFISLRTKQALQSAKERGTKLGGLRDKTNQRNIAKREQAQQFADNLKDIVTPMFETGKTLSAIAKILNQQNIPTANGGKWYASTVKNLKQRLIKSTNLINCK